MHKACLRPVSVSEDIGDADTLKPFLGRKVRFADDLRDRSPKASDNRMLLNRDNDRRICRIFFYNLFINGFYRWNMHNGDFYPLVF